MSLRLAIFILAAFSAAFSQSARITGRVLDPSGAPVPGAAIQLQSRDASLQRATIANNSGEYRFESVAPAAYLLTAEARDFAASPSLELRVDSGQSVARDLTLTLAAVASRAVVTASSTAQSIDEISKAFDVIDSAETARRQEYTLFEALRLTPGMRVVQLGGPGSLGRVQTRGTRTFDTSILIDGFRFRDASAPQGDAMAFFSDLLLVDTDRAEVLRGSGSSLYGTHAIGGAVNVVTGSGGGPLHGELTAEGGGLGMFRGVAKVGGGAWADRLRYTAGITHMNVTRGVDGDDRYRNSSAQASGQFQLAPRTVMGARLFANDSFVGLNLNPFALTNLPASGVVQAVEGVTFTTSLNDPDARRVSNFQSYLLNATHQFSPNASLRAYYQGLSTHRDNRDGPAGPRFQPQFPTSAKYDSRIDTAQIRTDFSLARTHLVSAGYEFERETYDNLSTDENPVITARTAARVQVNQSSHAAFAQDQLRFFHDRLQLSLSGRWQHFQLSSPAFAGGPPKYANITLANPPDAFTGDAALSYFLPSAGTKLRTHIGNAYRAPTLYERFGYSFFLGSFTAYGDPRLAPERALAVDFGIDQYLAHSRVRLSATYFYTRLQQVVGFDSSGVINATTDPFGRPFGGYRNTGGGLARGVELSAEATLSRRTRLQSSYTYTNAMERNPTLIGGSVKSIRISPHMATALLTHRIYRGLEATMDLFAASDYIYPFFVSGSRPFNFAGPVKMDLAVRYILPAGERARLEFYTRIENVLNRVYYEDGFRTPKAWAVGGVKIGF